MTPELREEMGQKAVAAAKAVNYEGAGTIEFLVDDKLNFYFLEMNTRLQVEHPITESVVGIDLVQEQIRIASGLELSRKQEDIQQRGHAIECRIYAEDADNNFMPSPGMIHQMTEPFGQGVRIDGYVYSGYEIPLFYDPMISKLIVWGVDRQEAMNRMKRALYEYKITGVKTSIRFLTRILETPDFVNGKYDTHFISKNEDFLMDAKNCDETCEDVVLIAVFMDYIDKLEKAGNASLQQLGSENWKNFGRKKGVLRW